VQPESYPLGPPSLPAPPLLPSDVLRPILTELGLSDGTDYSQSATLFFVVFGGALLLLCCAALVCWPYFVWRRKRESSKGKKIIHPVANSARDDMGMPPKPPPPNVVLNVLSSTRRFSAPAAIDRIGHTVVATILPSATGASPLHGTDPDELIEHSEPLLTNQRNRRSRDEEGGNREVNRGSTHARGLPVELSANLSATPDLGADSSSEGFREGFRGIEVAQRVLSTLEIDEESACSHVSCNARRG